MNVFCVRNADSLVSFNVLAQELNVFNFGKVGSLPGIVFF